MLLQDENGLNINNELLRTSLYKCKDLFRNLNEID